MVSSYDSPQDTKAALRRIRDYLAGQAVGLTRDESLLEEVLKCTYCRFHRERDGEPALNRALVDADQIAREYQAAFSAIKREFPGLFKASEGLLLSPEQIALIDQEFASIGGLAGTHDIVGDIYEAFIGSAYRGKEGQFFTPAVAVWTLVQLTDPKPDDTIIDPACGSGGFLLQAARHISSNGNGFVASRVHGIDKDSYLVRLSQLHLSLYFRTTFPIQCADSLSWEGDGFEKTDTFKLRGEFSLVLTNPPFGTKIVAVDKKRKADYLLARKWRRTPGNHRYEPTDHFLANPAPQVLFVERCMTLIRTGGRIGMVLPESVLSNSTYRYVVQHILDNATPIAVIGMPEALFKTSGKGGTHTKVCLVVLEKDGMRVDQPVFMAEAKWCGHDSRGRPIPKNDLPRIVETFRDFQKGRIVKSSRFGFVVPRGKLNDLILAPRYYNPEPLQLIEDLEETHEPVRLRDLIDAGVLKMSTGDEVGKLAYGTGAIPFVRTSDLSNWELKVDPKHSVSEEIYNRYAEKQDVREGDILMVKDGTYLIGTCAYISKYDTKMLYQSHLYKLRMEDNAPFDSYLLLALLSSPPVVSQIRSLSFTQDIIDSLGNRILDLVLPVPKDNKHRRRISEMVGKAIESRAEAREYTREAREAVVNGRFTVAGEL